MDDKKSQVQSTQLTDINLPVILRTIQEGQKQSNTNKSLFKEDSLSSIQQQPQIPRKPNIIINKIPAQVDQLKKFMKKANDLNNDNVKKLQLQKQVKQFHNYQRSSGSLYKFPKQLVYNISSKPALQTIKQIYIPKSINKTVRRPKIYKSKPLQVTKQVQTQKQIIKNNKQPIKENKKYTTIDIHQLQKNKNQNVSLIKSDNEQQFKIPIKKIKKVKFNNVQINKFNNVQINKFTNNRTIYLQEMSKRSYNFAMQVKRYSKATPKQDIQTSTFFNLKNQSTLANTHRPIIPLDDGFNDDHNDSRYQNYQTYNEDKFKSIKNQKPNTIQTNQINTTTNQMYQNHKNGNLGLKNYIKNIPNQDKQIDSFSVIAEKQSLNPSHNSDYKQSNIFRKDFKIRKDSQKKEENKKQFFVQVPSVHELKIGKYIPGNDQIIIHPIRNDFSENDVNWISSKFKPKTELINQIENSFQIKKYRNGVYFGELNSEGNKHGRGVIFYYNGRIYEGTFRNDLKEGKGYQGYPDKSNYIVEFQKGVKEGKGRFQWGNGQVYDGQWSNGKKNGSGMWKSLDGESYIGEWKNGKVEGFGVYTMSSGDRYQGEFYNSLKHGVGTQRYHNGDNFVGCFRKNRPNGQGQYFWSNGSYYKGSFINGLRHGKGYLKQQQQNFIYQGEFRNDKMCGSGKIQHINGQIYVGNFQNNLKHGYGQLYSEQKCLFKGYWINGQKVDENGIPIIEEQGERQQTIDNIQEKKKKKRSPITQFLKKQLKKSISNKKTLSNKKSPRQKKSIDSKEDEQICFKRACGCSRKH